MRMRFKYIHFVEVDAACIEQRIRSFVDHHAKAYECRNNKSRDALGYIVKYSPWRRYVFVPHGSVVLSMDCLADIKTFVAGVIADQKGA
jgi:hypothetical protein